MDEAISPEKRPIVQHGLDLPPDSLLSDCLPTINYPQNHISQSNTYSNPPTMADFKQMAMDDYNQRNKQNVSFSNHLFLFKSKNLYAFFVIIWDRTANIYYTRARYKLVRIKKGEKVSYKKEK